MGNDCCGGEDPAQQQRRYPSFHRATARNSAAQHGGNRYSQNAGDLRPAVDYLESLPRGPSPTTLAALAALAEQTQQVLSRLSTSAAAADHHINDGTSSSSACVASAAAAASSTDVLPQFTELADARSACCIIPFLVRTSRLGRTTNALSCDAVPLAPGHGAFDRGAALICIVKAFQVPHAEAATVRAESTPVLDFLQQLFQSSVRSNRARPAKALNTALRIMADVAGASEVRGALSQALLFVGNANGATRNAKKNNSWLHSVNHMIMAAGAILERRAVVSTASHRGSPNVSRAKVARSVRAAVAAARGSRSNKNSAAAVFSSPSRTEPHSDDTLPSPSPVLPQHGQSDHRHDDGDMKKQPQQDESAPPRPSNTTSITTSNTTAALSDSSLVLPLDVDSLCDPTAASPSFAGPSADLSDAYASCLDLDDLAHPSFAHSRAVDIVLCFIDDYKMKALSTVCIEPARWALASLKKDPGSAAETPLHAINAYITIIESTLGFAFSRQAADDDDDDPSSCCGKGFINVWSPETFVQDAPHHVEAVDRVFNVFVANINNSKQYESLSKELDDAVTCGGASDTENDDASGGRVGNFVFNSLFAARGVSTSLPEGRLRSRLEVDMNARQRFRPMLERFMSCFNYGTFIKSLIETCCSEPRAEYGGFVRAMMTLFKEFQRRGLDQKLAPRSSSSGGDGIAKSKNDDDDDDDDQEDVSSPRNKSVYSDVFDWFYDDDFFLQLNIDRSAMFLSWLGIVVPPERRRITSTSAASSSAEEQVATNPLRWPRHMPHFFSEDGGDSSSATPSMYGGGSGGLSDEYSLDQPDALEQVLQDCPICFRSVPGAEILPLEHADTTLGAEIADHKMCMSCYQKMISNSSSSNNAQQCCPFCRGALVSEAFVQQSRNFAQQMCDLRDDAVANRASAAEELWLNWQTIEMEAGGQGGRMLERILLSILRDPRCLFTRQRLPWLRRAAGIVFRFVALIEDRSLRNSPLNAIPSERIRALRDAVDFILEPFEKPSLDSISSNTNKKMDGADISNLINQTLAALLTAQNSGMSVKTLQSLAHRTVAAVTGAFSSPASNDSQEEKEAIKVVCRKMIIPQYVQAAAPLLWGGGVGGGGGDDAADPITRTFLLSR